MGKSSGNKKIEDKELVLNINIGHFLGFFLEFFIKLFVGVLYDIFIITLCNNYYR